jgi:hypothetical protein
MTGGEFIPGLGRGPGNVRENNLFGRVCKMRFQPWLLCSVRQKSDSGSKGRAQMAYLRQAVSLGYLFPGFVAVFTLNGASSLRKTHQGTCVINPLSHQGNPSPSVASHLLYPSGFIHNTGVTSHTGVVVGDGAPTQYIPCGPPNSRYLLQSHTQLAVNTSNRCATHYSNYAI